MQINGITPYETGTIVLRQAESLNLVINGQVIEFVFTNSGGEPYQAVEDNKVIFNNSDTINASINAFSGKIAGNVVQATFVYNFFIADGKSEGVRVIHYTVMDFG